MTNTIKQHDTWPFLTFAFKDALGVPINCIPYTVRLLIRNRQKLVVVDAVIGAVDSDAVWIDQNTGEGEYHWQEEDTEVVGVYQYEFEFTRISDGKVFTLPQDTYFTFSVTDDIA